LRDFSIILNSFPPWLGLCPGPAVRAYEAPPGPLVGWGGDAPSILIGPLDLGVFLPPHPNTNSWARDYATHPLSKNSAYATGANVGRKLLETVTSNL